METKVIEISSIEENDKLIEAANMLKSGGLVAFPTETVYGIGANALKVDVVKKIYEAKGRPSDNPLIVHLGESGDVRHYVRSISDDAQKLMKAFWPGPLTLIFEKNDLIPDAITGGLETVAIRVPKHPIARKIIQLSGLPIAAPSANISGKPSPTMAKHVIEDLSGRVDMIVDGGDANIGLESTVLDLTGDKPMILRPGGVTKPMIESIIGAVTMDRNMLGTEHKGLPKSPGMKYRHYAPKGRLTIYRGSDEQTIEAINDAVIEDQKNGLTTGVISLSEHKHRYKGEYVIEIGSIVDPEEIASNLFKVLREMDELGVECIYSPAFQEGAISDATMNRLLKAAGNRCIDL